MKLKKPLIVLIIVILVLVAVGIWMGYSLNVKNKIGSPSALVKGVQTQASSGKTGGGGGSGNNITFKGIYDKESANVQSCLKAALAGEFSKTYSDPTYMPSVSAMGAADACLTSTSTATTTVGH
jgi:type II secretory pathway pseudopilin PulG